VVCKAICDKSLPMDTRRDGCAHYFLYTSCSTATYPYSDASCTGAAATTTRAKALYKALYPRVVWGAVLLAALPALDVRWVGVISLLYSDVRKLSTRKNRVERISIKRCVEQTNEIIVIEYDSLCYCVPDVCFDVFATST
jgi:hypothetical protein